MVDHRAQVSSLRQLDLLWRVVRGEELTGTTEVNPPGATGEKSRGPQPGRLRQSPRVGVCGETGGAETEGHGGGRRGQTIRQIE